MKSESAEQPKGFNAMLKRAGRSLFAPKHVPGRDAIAEAAERVNVDHFLSDLDTILARSKAAQRKRMLEQ